MNRSPPERLIAAIELVAIAAIAIVLFFCVSSFVYSAFKSAIVEDCTHHAATVIDGVKYNCAVADLEPK